MWGRKTGTRAGLPASSTSTAGFNMLSSIASRLTRKMTIVPNLVRPSAANGVVAAAVQQQLQHQVRAHEMEMDLEPPSPPNQPAVFAEQHSAMVVDAQPNILRPKISVVGVGGAGSNAVNNMIVHGLSGVEFIVCNTDAQALEQSLAPTTVQLGAGVTSGLGAGAKPEVGRKAAIDSTSVMLEHLADSHMCFITAGLGGGTGTGAGPIVARALRDRGVLTVGVVTKPFPFEGSKRTRIAEAGLLEMQECCDATIVIPNQNLFRLADKSTSLMDAFKLADDVLYSGVQSITQLITMPGLVNLDFADVRAVLSGPARPKGGRHGKRGSAALGACRSVGSSKGPPWLHPTRLLSPIAAWRARLRACACRAHFGGAPPRRSEPGGGMWCLRQPSPTSPMLRSWKCRWHGPVDDGDGRGGGRGPRGQGGRGGDQ